MGNINYIYLPQPVVRAVWHQPFFISGAGSSLANTFNTYASAICADGQQNNVYWTIPVPTDYAVLVGAKVLIIPNGTGDCDMTLNVAYAAAGQAYNTHTGSIAETQYAMVNNELYAFDISSALASIAAGDFIGVEYIRYGAAVLDTINNTIRVLGVLLEYRN